MSVHYPNEVVATKYVRDAFGTANREDAPMTLGQASYLMTLCEETGEVFDDSLSQAAAAQLIAQLEDATGRGRGHGASEGPA